MFMDKTINYHDLPTGVEIRHLVTLDAISRTNSFSKAGELLGYAQSAISQQMAMLEKSVGHKLIERPGGPRPVSLTMAGEVLLRHAAEITARMGAAKADLDALAAGEMGTLRIGTFQSASARLLPPTLVKFRENWPGVSFEVRGEAPGQLVGDLVRAGKLDLAFADITVLPEPFAAEHLITDPYVLITPLDHPLVGSGPIDLRQLIGARMISASTDDACSQRLEQAFQTAGVATHIVFRSDDNLTAQRLVSSGLGIAIVPLLAVELDVPNSAVAVLALADDKLERHIGISWHRDRFRSKASDAFVAAAVHVAREIERQNAVQCVRA
jgi:DNA-binding transcriptional LysR family regulator